MLTTGKAAAVLQVSDQTIRRYIDSGKLLAERLPDKGSHRRIKRSDLEAFAAVNGLTLDWSKLEAA